MLKPHRRSTASLLVVRVHITAGAPQLPDCSPLSMSSLSASPSNDSWSPWWTSKLGERSRVSHPATPTSSLAIAPRVWHIISPVTCGQIEVERDTETFGPHENRWMLQCCRLSTGFFLPALLLYKRSVSCSIMDSWWQAFTAHFQKQPKNAFSFFGMT